MSSSKFTFILGPHRSGTSLVAGMINDLGVNLGEDFIAKNHENPKGFFEDEKIVNFNDRLLRYMNLSWDSLGFIWHEDFSSPRFDPYRAAAAKLLAGRFTGVAWAGLKDPRFCLLLPFWQRVVADVLGADTSYVLVVRDPLQCAASQALRQRQDPDFYLMGRRREHSVLLWLTYVYRALEGLCSERFLVSSYAGLMQAPQEELRRIRDFLGIEVIDERIDVIAGEFVEPALNRSQALVRSMPASSAKVEEISRQLYTSLQQWSKIPSVPPAELAAVLAEHSLEQLSPRYLEATQALYGYAYRKVINLRHRIILMIHEIDSHKDSYRHLESRYAALEAQHEQLKRQHDEILLSKSWKLITRFQRGISLIRNTFG